MRLSPSICRAAFIVSTTLACTVSIATVAIGQNDAIWDHQQNVQNQQAEERRMNEIIMQMNGDVGDMQDGASGSSEYAPNAFVSFPPEAWTEWVEHGRDLQAQELEDRFGKDPAYRDLVKGVWTYRRPDGDQSAKICAATFWTRNGGVSFIHLGGKEDFTFLGFFGAGIPSVKKPRTVELDLIQSGETQHARVLNIHFGSVASMGMILFKVPTPAILLGAIEDRQDFELRLSGKTIAQGEWQGGLAARDELRACLNGKS